MNTFWFHTFANRSFALLEKLVILKCDDCVLCFVNNSSGHYKYFTSKEVAIIKVQCIKLIKKHSDLFYFHIQLNGLVWSRCRSIVSGLGLSRGLTTFWSDKQTQRLPEFSSRFWGYS